MLFECVRTLCRPNTLTAWESAESRQRRGKERQNWKAALAADCDGSASLAALFDLRCNTIYTGNTVTPWRVRCQAIFMS